MNYEKILDTHWDSSDLDNPTVREYLHALLHTLWEEGESFSGKRPFGNSGWEFDLYKPLVAIGVVKGEIDEYGYVQDVDTKNANKLIFKLIRYVFFGDEE